MSPCDKELWVKKYRFFCISTLLNFILLPKHYVPDALWRAFQILTFNLYHKFCFNLLFTNFTLHKKNQGYVSHRKTEVASTKNWDRKRIVGPGILCNPPRGSANICWLEFCPIGKRISNFKNVTSTSYWVIQTTTKNSTKLIKKL